METEEWARAGVTAPGERPYPKLGRCSYAGGSAGPGLLRQSPRLLPASLTGGREWQAGQAWAGSETKGAKEQSRPCPAPGSSSGWPGPISRQLTQPPAHSQPLQLHPHPWTPDWPRQAGAAWPPPQTRLSPHPDVWFQEAPLCVRMLLSTWGLAQSRANAFSKCWFNHQGITIPAHLDTLPIPAGGPRPRP